MERTDILEKNGLEAEVTPFLYGPPMQEALLAGHIDIALTSEANFVNLAAKFPCKMIGTLGSAGRIAVMVKTDSPVKSVADLKGKTVVTVFGTSAHYPAVQWLLKAGLDPAKDVKLLHMAAAEGRAALLKGDIDAIVMWDPFVEDFVQKKAARILKYNPSFWTTTVASEEFLKRSPAAAEKFLLALHEAALFMARNKDLVNGWLSKTMNVAPALIDKGSSYNTNYAKAKKLKQVDIVPGAELLERLDAIADFNLHNGLLKQKSPVREKTDLSFVKAAAKTARSLKFDAGTVAVREK
ncbi:MAG TPA: NrtA/SsuA/CpmA family ABC transporter substrate-binding protein [Elusimicrobiales bacterium]|nr:NrtA/SsuA/CpmA family ABC transporter substrate-binding protein [Elusimicrobiales bacterium]